MNTLYCRMGIATPLSLVGIVEFPSLPERSAHRRMQWLWQPLDYVAGFVNLTALDRRMGTEGSTDDFAQRLGTVDDEQPTEQWCRPV
jgi:hypothetical protein